MSEAADLYGFSQDYLGELARKGRLQAPKVGKFWVTTFAEPSTAVLVLLGAAFLFPWALTGIKHGDGEIA